MYAYIAVSAVASVIAGGIVDYVFGIITVTPQLTLAELTVILIFSMFIIGGYLTGWFHTQEIEQKIDNTE